MLRVFGAIDVAFVVAVVVVAAYGYESVVDSLKL